MTRLETNAATPVAMRPQSAAERFGVMDRPELKYTPAVARETAHLYERVRRHIPEIEWPVYAPYIHAINRIKKERGA
ncbi:MAG: quinolinate synthase NadA, partial [Hoeflea sp.]|nr:quinolinate synthase NadA [Hoeflea sp.]